MFMEIAIGAIGIGIVLMVGYVIVSQVKVALPSNVQMQMINPCYGHLANDTTYCNVSSYTDPVYGTIPGPLSPTSQYISVTNSNVNAGLTSTMVTVFAGFSLIAVGIIVLAAFGLINIFK
jgi:hypothetical protein